MRMDSRRTFLAGIGGTLLSARFSWGANEVPALLDHILLGCSDLGSGIAFAEERLGVRAAFGGVHPGRGTQNALLSLGTRHYLEIIAPDPKQAGAKLPQTLELQRRNLLELSTPRLTGWAAHPGSLDQYAARLRSAGIAFVGPWAGSRKRPDGRFLHWKALILADDHGGVLPFFIEWSGDSVHPSTDAPGGARLVQFSIGGPSAADLAKICKSLDIDIRVSHSEKPQLHAKIAGLREKIMDVSS